MSGDMIGAASDGDGDDDDNNDGCSFDSKLRANSSSDDTNPIASADNDTG